MRTNMRTKMQSIPVLIAVVALGAAGCNPQSSTTSKADVPRDVADPALAETPAAAINAFGLDLYKHMAEAEGNVVYSPTSIALALGMARAGARGQTAIEMDAVLHELATDENAAALNSFDAALAERTIVDEDGDPTRSVTLRIVNAPFAQRDMEFVDGYLDVLASRFGSGFELVDYRADPGGAREAINDWVADQTEERIPQLLPPESVRTDTRLFLVNAIYLKAAWRQPFEEEATRPGPFTLQDGTIVEVPMMRGIDHFGYAAGDGWRAVELPYVGGSLALTMIVPDDMSAFENSLTPELVAGIAEDLAGRSVELAFPRFKVETNVKLADVLAPLGMPTAFDLLAADFSGITVEEPLFIGEVFHQANIDVDEEGTEAAAATAIGMPVGSMPEEPVAMTIDRPFLFVLRDIPTGAILFLGRVTDPNTTD